MEKIRSCFNKGNKDDDQPKEITIHFGADKEHHNSQFTVRNKTRTAKYTWYSWLPLSILFQFGRAANIYFLIITILTMMPFSPKSQASMVGTFASVLVFTSFKELFEDIFRMISDNEVNNAKAQVLDYGTKKFMEKRWKDIKLGDIIRIAKDETFPCDMLCISSRKEKVNVDTMNLDGETMLKPKKIVDDTIFQYIKGAENESESVIDDEKDHRDVTHLARSNDINKYAHKICQLKGNIVCSPPNEDIEHWDGSINIDEFVLKKQDDKKILGDIDSMLLRGCYLRNTTYCIGIAVHLGQESKIMMNAKKPPRKVSNLMKMMNRMLYTVFGFQLCIISIYATCSVIWTRTKGKDYEYIDEDGDNPNFGTWIIQLLTYWVAYSHLIPISLYVMIEVLKLVQALLIKWDEDIGAHPDVDEKPAECKNSDLIEELGQVDFVFSDKTGTLTCNQMIFKSCTVGGKIYSDQEENGNMDERSSYQVRNSQESLNDYSNRDQNNDQLNWLNEVNKGDDKLYDFFSHMSICHSVTVDVDSKEETSKEDNEEMEDTECPVYQCQSPDELALVKASLK